jgi:hypothetical protein
MAAVAGDAAQTIALAAHLQLLGRVADALEVLGSHVADPGYDDAAAEQHRAAVEEAQRRLADHPNGDCPCGTGITWSACCQAREAAAVAGFADRSGMYALRTAVTEYLTTSVYEKPLGEHVADWFGTAGAKSWPPTEQEALYRLAVEHAWVAAGLDDRSDDDHDNVLSALAADGDTPTTVAAAAAAWLDGVWYGLWQVPDPSPGPGLWCVELVSGHQRYVALAAEQTEGLTRWAVLAGAIVPLDGAWRATGTLIRLSPPEADGMCETIRAAGETIVGEVAGKPDRRAAARARRPTPFAIAPPHNVYAYLQEPATPSVTERLSQVTGSLLPRLLGELQSARATPPAMTNTDGDPLRLIKARIRVRDAAQLEARLADHPDFDPDGDGGWSWLGQHIPEAQHAAMFAEARAQLRLQGHPDGGIAESDGSKRWIRGQLRRDRDELTVQINSQQRLDRLIAILDECGAQPTIIDQSRVDPTQDLPWTPGQRVMRGGQAPVEEGWARHWLDERVPALRGRTPRETARSDDWPLLEGLLRQFEYAADTAGNSPELDPTAWLRDQLDMPIDGSLDPRSTRSAAYVRQ